VRAKAEADDYLRRAIIRHLIVRPAQLSFVAGSGTISIEPNTAMFTPISRDDVADVMSRLITGTAIRNETVDLMGGDAPIDQAIDIHLSQKSPA
jgi:uncharacterized protein YbjT (DUF2867 family)